MLKQCRSKNILKKPPMIAKGFSPKKLLLKVSCCSDQSSAFLSLFLVPVAKIYQNKKQTLLDIRSDEIQL